MTATTTRPPAVSRRASRVTDAARHDVRRTLLALLASAIGVVPLCQLFTDRGWLIDVWLSMLIVVGPAALLRLRRAPSAAQIWIGVVLLVPYLTARYVHQHAFAGTIPLGRTWHDVGALMTNLHHTTTDEAAPIHSTIAVRLAICTLLGLVAALVDLIAVVGRRGALAGIPLLIVFTVSGAVPRQVVSWQFFVAAAAAFLLLLALDSSDDLQRWGHYVPRAGTDRRRASGAAGAISGQRIAAAAIVLAILLPAFVPSDSRNLVANLFHNGKGGGSGGGFGAGGGGGIDPFVALKGELDHKTPLNLFDVSVRSLSGDEVGEGAAIQPFYLRENVLSRFIGTGWVAGSTGTSQSLDGTNFASSPGIGYPPLTVAFRATVDIHSLDANPPIFAVPTAVSGLSRKTKWNPQDQLLLGSQVNKGDSYQLTVAQPAPSTARLSAATASDPALAPWLTLPHISAYVTSLVTRIIGNSTTPYAKARAISNYFANPANGFSYSLSTATGDSGDELVDFLQKKTGYCQQYAAAMGVMLRLAHVPSRVVLGYTHPVPDQTGHFTVTTDDAHAWVEAYFSGIGWIPFDPTPLSGIAGGSSNDLPWAPHSKDGNNTNLVPTVTPTVGSVTPKSAATTSAPAPATSSSSGGWTSGLTVPLLVLVLIVIVLVVALIPWAVRQRRRRHRLRLGRHGDTDALWRELSDTAVDLGYVWSASRTPRQVARWLAEPAGSAAGSLQTLASAVERARYAPPVAVPSASPAGSDAAGPTGGDVAGGGAGGGLVDQLAEVRAGLSAHRARGERVRSQLLPASLGWHLPRWLPGTRRRH